MNVIHLVVKTAHSAHTGILPSVPFPCSTCGPGYEANSWLLRF